MNDKQQEQEEQGFVRLQLLSALYRAARAKEIEDAQREATQHQRDNELKSA